MDSKNMPKNPVSFHFIIASPVYSVKPLSKYITSIFKLFYEKSGNISYKRKSMAKNQDLLDYAE